MYESIFKSNRNAKNGNEIEQGKATWNPSFHLALLHVTCFSFPVSTAKLNLQNL